MAREYAMLHPVAGPRAFQIAVLAVLLSNAQAASASSYSVAYEASASCPTKDEFVAEVESRLPTWRHAEGAGDRGFRVSLSHDGGQAVGKIFLGATEQPRVVRGDSCVAVARALALILAVTLDPVAALAAKRATSAPPRQPPRISPVVVEPRSPVLRSPSGRSSPSWALGASGGVLFGPAPTAMYGASVDAEVGSTDRRFAARVAASRLITGRVDVGPGRAHFKLTRARLGLCYRSVAEAASIAGCLAFGAGSLEADAASNQNLERADRSQRLWAATGGDGLASVRLLGPLSLQVAAELSVPLSRWTYFYENPKETVHTVAPVAVGIGAGVVVALP